MSKLTRLLKPTVGSIAIQNTTFGGLQGFQQPIDTPLIVEGQGQVGVWHEERKLLYAEYARMLFLAYYGDSRFNIVFLVSGHMVPEYQPLAGLKSIVRQFNLTLRDL